LGSLFFERVYLIARLAKKLESIDAAGLSAGLSLDCEVVALAKKLER
jgi:hypothetical protein